MTMKRKDWYSYAESTITRIKEFRQTSALGNYTYPDEYMDIIEDYAKLFYEINGMPASVVHDFIATKRAFEEFKNKLTYFCDVLLKQASKNDNDTAKDQEASQTS